MSKSKTPTQHMVDELVEKVMLYLRAEECFADGSDDADQETLEFYEGEVRAAITSVISPNVDVVAVYTPADIEHVMDDIFVPAWREDYSPAWRMKMLNEIIHSSEMRQAFEQVAGDIIYRKLGIT